MADGEDAIALAANGMAVTAQTPAHAGEVIDVLALGLGAVAGSPPVGGTLAESVGAVHVPQATRRPAGRGARFVADRRFDCPL